MSLTNLQQQLNAVLKGQEAVTESVLSGFLAGGHVLLEGVPGLGKTLLLSTLAKLVDMKFSRIQFTPDLMPADITGTRIVEEDEHGHKKFRFEPGPVFGNLVLADEINRATPKTQSALLEAMQERQVTAGGQRHELPQPFFVMATQNPIEQEGTYPLPEAQMDRFLMKVIVTFPQTSTLSDILRENIDLQLSSLSPVMSIEELKAVMQQARDIPVARHVYDYMACLVSATHPGGTIDSINRFVLSGSSPRGALALRDVSRALACLRGLDHVSTALVKEIVPLVLGHRLQLSFEARAENIRVTQLLDDVTQNVPEHPEEVSQLLEATQK